eukprot:CAMPEP_0185745708 /NCGR_PEP_ID=MMETSP1174-20130828/4101_1 /TAXON_ID=35687 /ORGANISM="Dictyocha speculum, Strain CCMP1381" /LENGTH=318 /DNA_ID=CAMNT_0028419891 /DNA_START=1 /DNA_END=957 /DNA_ORIENTATION=+
MALRAVPRYILRPSYAHTGIVAPTPAFIILSRSMALRAVPRHILRPSYAHTGIVAPSPTFVVVQGDAEIQALERAGSIARRMLEVACSLAQPGVTTDDIDAVVHNRMIEAGVYPAPLNYRGFPKSICASVNNEICHGIPNKRPLEDGDIVKFDVSVYTEEGFFGDNCASICVGEVDERGLELVTATSQALTDAITKCVPGGCLSQIGEAIHSVADAHSFESVTRYCGHGIGSSFHSPPMVFHCRNRERLELLPGMVFTIEPMLVEGCEDCTVMSDEWTVVTKDGSRSAQYEHMVAVTPDGPRVLTAGQQDGNSIALPF